MKYCRRLLANGCHIVFDHFNRRTEFCRIAPKVFIALPCLLQQKPSRQSKSKDHSKKLKERQELWNEGRINDLMREN